MYYDLYVTSPSHSHVLQDRGYLKDMIRLRTVLKEYFREHGWIEGEDYTIDILITSNSSEGGLV